MSKVLVTTLLAIPAAMTFSTGPELCIGQDQPCGECVENYPNGMKITYMTPEMFYNKWTNDECDMVMDVRPADAYEEGHIEGAFNAPGLAGSIENLPEVFEACKEKKICVHCRTGRLARMAAHNLKDAGFNYLFVMGQGALDLEEDSGDYPCSAGYGDWAAAGWPTATGPQVGNPQC